MASDIQKYAKLALLVLSFAAELEEILDPEEKSEIDDMILRLLTEVAQKLSE